MTWRVIVPTNRPERNLQFLKDWSALFTKHSIHLYLMQDLPETDKALEKYLQTVKYRYTLLNWSNIELKTIPTKTDMIRSWGFYQAWSDSDSGDYCLTLDDDLIPIIDIFKEYEEDFRVGSAFSPYLSVGALTNSALEMRGFPYKDRKVAEVAVQYGGWEGVLDYDAATQLALPQEDKEFLSVVMPVPQGVPTTCCIMNAAWKVEYTPIMWQLPMLEGRYNRIGDIWSGLFIKKTLDSLRKVMVINGNACVRHERASNPYTSLQKEAPSVILNESMWENLINPSGNHLIDSYIQVTNSAGEYIARSDQDYAQHFIKARDEWLGLFDD